jgi:hypothetical protein
MLYSAKPDEHHPQVLVVTAMDGAEIRYLMKNGLLHPGRVWTSLGPGNERVVLFLPLPDGPPEVLAIES